MAVEAAKCNTATGELLQLAKHLKQEHLFVKSERLLLKQIFEDVTQTADRLFQLSWITRQQRQTLNSLCLASVDAPPNECCHRANALESVDFIDSYRSLGSDDTYYGYLLGYLRENPKLLGQCLTIGEQHSVGNTRSAVNAIMSGIYSNCVVQADERNALFLLQSLMENQLANSDDPRRLLRKGRCAFSQVFKLFTENLFASRLYLTAALHKPIMGVLMGDEKSLETNPQKALAQFTSEEIMQMFGTLGSDEYHQKLATHLEEVSDKLVALCNCFMTSLKSNSYCFPQSLDWIISQMHKILSKSEHIDQTELRAMCADLLMVHFICPAIVDPEPYGITSDVMISETARTNLMQVGQILQGLTQLSGLAEGAAEGNSLYSKFAKGCMSSFLDVLIDNMSASDSPPTSIQLQGMARNSCLITRVELDNLVAFLRAVTATNPDNPEFDKLIELLSPLPSPPTPPSGSDANDPLSTSPKIPTLTPPSTPPIGMQQRKHGGSLAQKAVSSVSKKIGRQTSQPALKEEDEAPELVSPDPLMTSEVLVITIGDGANDCPGTLPEHKVLSSIPVKSQLSDETDSEKSNKSNNLVAINEIPKQLRFEVGSTGASNSIYSDNMDLGEENASMLSGRQTPHSAVSLASMSSTADHSRPDLIDSAQLPNNTNITDRFGKFDIGTNLDGKRAGNPGDDTWSTDVCGSDSEPPSEANPNERLQEISEVQEMEAGARGGAPVLQNLLDPSETASETWSVDALQSDSEHPNDRLQEVEEVPQEEIVQTLMLEAEGDQSSSKASEGHSSRRSSCESHSIGRSSNNGSPGVDDGGKKDGGSDEGSSGQFFDSSDNPSLLKGSSTEDSTNSSMGGDIPQPSILLPMHSQPDPFKDKLRPDRTGSNPQYGGHQNTSGRSSSNTGVTFPDQFDPFSSTSSMPQAPVSGSSTMPTLAPTHVNDRSTSPSMSKIDNLLADFDPFSNAPLSNLNTPRFPVDPMLNNNNKPLGAKPKMRTMNKATVLQQQSLGTRANPMYNNFGFDDNFTPPPVQRHNPFDNLQDPASRSHFNPGFFDMDLAMNPGAMDPLDPFSPTNSQFSATKPNGSAFHGLGDDLTRPDSGHVSGSSSSQEHLSQRTSSSVSNSSSGNASFLTSSQEEASVKMADGSMEKSLQEKMPNGGVRLQNENLSYSAETLNLYAEKDGDISKSTWMKNQKTKFSKFLRKTAKKPSSKDSPNTRYDAREFQSHRIHDMGTGTPERKDSDPIRILANPIVADHLKDDELRSASVPIASSEDIMDKYRELSQARSSENLDRIGQNESPTDDSVSKPDSSGSDPLFLDPENIESSYTFADAKRKLRMVLRAADFQTLPWLCNFSPTEAGSGVRGSGRHDGDGYPENDLVAFLKVQLAEAMNLQDRHLIAQLRETLRCVQNFDNDGCKKLLQSLRKDYERRTPYIAYLIRSRKGLISSRAHLVRLLERVQRDKETVNKYFTMVCVRLFLERQETSVQKFITDFKALTAADEKTYLVMFFIRRLHQWIQNDPIWQDATDGQMTDAIIATERNIMSRIYKMALYPNGDGDVARDQVLHEHVKRLCGVVSVSHRALKIPQKYWREAPWPAAQAEILNINVYKTPKDKLQCIHRCCMIIMTLMNISSDHALGADDFTPVLMFVLIKANPPSLLSTVQYINSFYYDNTHRISNDDDEGEYQYYWMQFCGAIEYIKTIDDRR